MTCSTPPASTGRRVLKAVTALGALLVVIGGVPALLIGFGLAPHALPSIHDVSTSLRSKDTTGRYFLIGGAAAVWIAWAVFTAITVKQIAVSIRFHGPRPTLPATGLGRLTPAALVAAIAILFVAAPAASSLLIAHAADAAAPASASASAASSTRQAAPVASGQAHHPGSARGSGRHTTPPRQSERVCIVQRYDTLWSIAARHLPGDPAHRYKDIARLNPQAVGPGDEIRPGTVLTMPADAHGLAEPAQVTTHTVRVHEGDTLSGLAAQDGVSDWTQAWPDNEGHPEPGGRRFTDPDVLMPGDILELPGPGTSASPATTTPISAGQLPTTPARARPQPAPTRSAPAQPAAPGTPEVPATPAGTAPASVPGRHVEAPPASAQPAQAAEKTVLAFAGGALLLAGVSSAALVTYRRRQWLRRRPGRTVSGSPPGLVHMERAVMAAGPVGLGNVIWLDEALRSLVQWTAGQPGGRLPDVIAVRMTGSELTLVLTGPAPSAPPPWQVADDAARWTIQSGDTLPYDAGRRDCYFAPFPTLTSVGYTATGEQWMLDLERVAALSLCGDAGRCLDLARFLAAELAHNTWSEMLQVTLVGFGEELVAANPDRLTYTDDLAAAATAVSARRAGVNRAMAALDTDVLTGRLHDIVGEEWAPSVLLIAPHLAQDTTALDELLTAVKHQHTRASVALVLAGDPDRADATRWQLTIDHRGILSVPALGLELIAQRVPADEAAPLAQMLAYAATSGDAPIPPAHGDQPWDKYADACGGLILPPTETDTDTDSTATTDGDDSPTAAPGRRRGIGDAAAVPVLHLAESSPWTRDCVLPLSPQTYLDKAATTADDLSALAPVVDARIRGDVERANRELDADLHAWDDAANPRPKLTLLGCVRVRAQGALPSRGPQEAFHTEIVAFLAGRSNGVSSAEFAETMWPTDPHVVGKPKVRQYTCSTRRWLGADPATGEEYLPSGLYDGTVARYRIDGLLCDAHLFRRLRTRATARGEAGIEDLWRALTLVEGTPFGGITIRRDDDTGPGGWRWLINANDRLDLDYQTMVVDTAHTAAVHHLGADEPDLAAKAAQVALKAGTYDAVPLLDLVAACLAREQVAEAEGYVRQLLSNAGVEREQDLEPRTAEVLSRLRRRWRGQAS